jgi:starch phosphorylase
MALKKTQTASATIDKEYVKQRFDEHLRRTLAIISQKNATDFERFLALAHVVRDQLIDRWVKTQETYYQKNSKRVYYLSLEFLMGRTLGNAMVNLDIDGVIADAMHELGLNLEELREMEVDAGLGNGGLGRLAACFLDSMATLEIPATGMGIRYEFGIFHQMIDEQGNQVEKPDNWLRLDNPWEIARPQYAIRIPFGGFVSEYRDDQNSLRSRWEPAEYVLAMPYDTPIPGCKNNTVNNLRLWSARSADDFGLDYFNKGDYLAAVRDIELSENISKVLYPNDASVNGKELRLKQQFFLCAASLRDILRRYTKVNGDIQKLHEKIAIQLNDTHPAVAIPEMMRLLLDEEGLNWDDAWDQVTKIFAYTNHTLMPEALEKWEVSLFERLLPRHLQIIYEINHRFLREVSFRWPGDIERLRRMSIIEEDHGKRVRMAYLAIVGSHKVNGVAALHSQLLTETLFHDFFELWPDKFNNKTNGITQRRWLRKANPALSRLIQSKIGDAWVLDLDQMRELEKFAEDKDFQKSWRDVKHANKVHFADYLKATQGVEIDPSSLFDVQVKRIHEYKRQLLPALYAVHLYNRIKRGDTKGIVPRTIMVGGKAAPGYWMAKQIIRLINSIANTVNSDPQVNQLLRVVFLVNYRVSLAEKIIPASDLSEQVSTAGTEASGTGNMKFALNGALTVGTLDGANVEIGEEVGDDNIFIFGHTVDEVNALKPNYRPWEWVERSPNLKAVLELINSGFFAPESPEAFRPIIDTLMSVDPYLVCADFDKYVEAQEKVAEAYFDQERWTKMAILNVARMGKFSTDRTIRQYNDEIWKAEYTPIEL